MTISQLITLLNEYKDKYGDLKVSIMSGGTKCRFMQPVPLKDSSLRVYPPQFNNDSRKPVLLELAPEQSSYVGLVYSKRIHNVRIITK